MKVDAPSAVYKPGAAGDDCMIGTVAPREPPAADADCRIDGHRHDNYRAVWEGRGVPAPAILKLA